MREYQLKNAPGITLTYSVVSPPQEQTHDQEGLDAGIEIVDIHILGRRVNDAKLDELLNANKGVWCEEILDSLKRGNNGRQI